MVVCFVCAGIFVLCEFRCDVVKAVNPKLFSFSVDFSITSLFIMNFFVFQ